MKWNRASGSGGSSCTDLFDLDHSAISFRGTRNAVAMNRMSVERRRFLRGVPGVAMALLARGTGRAETGMGAHLSVAYEDVGRQIASDLVGFSYESAILATGKTRRAHPARPAHLASRRGRMGMPYAAGASSRRSCHGRAR